MKESPSNPISPRSVLHFLDDASGYEDCTHEPLEQHHEEAIAESSVVMAAPLAEDTTTPPEQPPEEAHEHGPSSSSSRRSIFRLGNKRKLCLSLEEGASETPFLLRSNHRPLHQRGGDPPALDRLSSVSSSSSSSVSAEEFPHRRLRRRLSGSSAVSDWWSGFAFSPPTNGASCSDDRPSEDGEPSVLPARSAARPLHELWLGPVFDGPQAVLSEIRGIPDTVRHLDLDLRNALPLLPRALNVLFDPEGPTSHLCSLSLRFFGDQGALALADKLPSDGCLRQLDLRENRLGPCGLAALAAALPRSLRGIDLSCNRLVGGTGALRDLLLGSGSLERLDLGHNPLGDDAIDELCEGLSGNTSLRELSLEGCHKITPAGIRRLEDCLARTNHTLFRLRLPAGDGHRTTEIIPHLLSLNRAGRALLKDDTAACPASLWPVVLAKAANNPSALGYLVRQAGPHLIEGGTR